MSAHLELDFNDDGSIALTSRTVKGGEIQTRELAKPWAEILIRGGDDDTVTHRVAVTDAANMIINGREWAS